MSMLGAVTEFECSMIWKRQREGIELAKKRVVYKRRKPTDAVKIEKAREQINPGSLLAKGAIYALQTPSANGTTNELS